MRGKGPRDSKADNSAPNYLFGGTLLATVGTSRGRGSFTAWVKSAFCEAVVEKSRCRMSRLFMDRRLGTGRTTMLAGWTGACPRPRVYEGKTAKVKIDDRCTPWCVEERRVVN